jgi:ACS family glucarate transporter-like MFS transporter
MGFLFFYSALVYLDRLAIAVASPDMQVDFGRSASQWGWVLGAFALAYGLMGVPAGRWCDRLGPRRFIAGTTILVSLFTGLTGMVRGISQLVSVRFLFGATGAGVFPSTAATVSRWFPARERGWAQGIVLMASRFGGIVAPLLLVPLLHRFGWRLVFLILGALGMAWAPLWHGWARDHPSQKRGVSAAELAEAPPQLAARSRTFAWGKALAEPNLWWIMLMYYTYCWSAYFYLSWFYVFLEKGRGYSRSDVLALAWLPFALGALANLAGGWCSDRSVSKLGLKWGRRVVGIAGLAASTVFLAGVVLVHGKLLSMTLLALGFAASDFMNPTAWAVCLDAGGPAAGTVGGAMNMAGQAGSFCSAVAFGYWVDAWHSYDRPLIPIVAFTAVSSLLWLKIDPEKSIGRRSDHDTLATEMATA